MVPGDHHHPDPRSVRFSDGHRSFRTGWVDDPHRADEDQGMLQILRRFSALVPDDRSVGHRQRTQRVCGEFGHIRKNPLPDFVGQLDDIGSYSDPVAASQQHIWRAFL